MMLDLFITHWNEPWEIGETGLEMIKLQRQVDWENVRVTIVHDGSDPFPSFYFDDFPCEIRQACIPHGGIAAARNWCIDHSTAEWIKWNDFDDSFSSLYSLRIMMDGLKQADNYDLAWFSVYAEVDGIAHPKDDMDPVVLHGKAFRREFLIDHGIRFQEDLTWCEDSAFLALLEMEIDPMRKCKIITGAPIYAWISRQGSLCNRPEIRFDNLKSFFERHKYVQEEMRKHGKIKAYTMMTARVLADSYFTLKLAGLTEDTSEHERQVYEYYKKHRNELLRLTKGAFIDVLGAVNRENQCHITKDDFTAWLRNLRAVHEAMEKGKKEQEQANAPALTEAEI